MSLPKPYYQDSYVTIYHGDCHLILPELPKVDLVLTDPPYGINYKHSASPNIKVKGRLTPPRLLGGNGIVGDDEPFDPTFLLGYPDVMLFGANHYTDLLPISHGWIVWDKLDGVTPTSFGDFDMIWHKNGTKNHLFRYLWRGICQAGEKGRKLHPNQKPIALIGFLINLTDAKVILDPFLGSGTTAYCAKKLNRKCIGIEIEEKYCEITSRRCS